MGPLPFTPDGDGEGDLLSIRVALPAEAELRLSVYSFEGSKVRTFSGPAVQQYFWDGRTDNGALAAVGPFFVIAEVQTPSGVRTIRKKGVLWR
jgi:cytochrome c peroxidase